MRMYLRWPTFESRDRKEGQHRLGDVIKVKTLLKPLSLFNDRSIDITVVEFQISAPRKESALHSFSESGLHLNFSILRECVLKILLQFFSLLRLIYP